MRIPSYLLPTSSLQLLFFGLTTSFNNYDQTIIIEMENPEEVSQILSGITFDRNNIF